MTTITTDAQISGIESTAVMAEPISIAADADPLAMYRVRVTESIAQSTDECAALAARRAERLQAWIRRPRNTPERI